MTHAILSSLFLPAYRVHRITILPSGMVSRPLHVAFGIFTTARRFYLDQATKPSVYPRYEIVLVCVRMSAVGLRPHEHCYDTVRLFCSGMSAGGLSPHLFYHILMNFGPLHVWLYQKDIRPLLSVLQSPQIVSAFLLGDLVLFLNCGLRNLFCCFESFKHSVCISLLNRPIVSNIPSGFSSYTRSIQVAECFKWIDTPISDIFRSPHQLFSAIDCMVLHFTRLRICLSCTSNFLWIYLIILRFNGFNGTFVAVHIGP